MVTKPTECSICKGELEEVGQAQFRAGGTGGVSKLFFGELAELGEIFIPIDIFRCKKCTHLEMYDLNKSIGKKDS